ncbi:MAG TPA: hypothetical protein VLT62_10995 [Candidatus Methylomirabilis sp.]|nr:hypothetical protein [Candidatus Methylomirabilis sp.]
MTAGGKMIGEMAGNGSPVFGDQDVAILLDPDKDLRVGGSGGRRTWISNRQHVDENIPSPQLSLDCAVDMLIEQETKLAHPVGVGLEGLPAACKA